MNKPEISKAEQIKLKKWLADNPNTCILPLIHFNIDTNGDMMPCCIGGAIEDENGTPLNIKDYTISELWNHPSREKFVKDLFAGKKPKQCEKCWSEKTQANSKRVHFSVNAKTRETAKEIYKNGIDLDTYDYKLKWLDIFPGNTCNLKCRICTWEYSSLWAKDWNQYKNPDLPFKDSEYHEYNKSCQWIDDPNVWNSIDETFKDLERLHILGGEPLMVTKHFDMLQELINKGYSKNITIEYNTNATYFFTEDQLNILKQFKKLQLNLSIDDIGPRFEYQRKNAIWEKVEANILKFWKLKKEMKAGITIDPAVSLFNVYYVWEFVNYFNSKNIDLDRISKGHWVHTRGLDIRELNASQRQQILDHIDKENNPEWIQIIVDRLKSNDYKEPGISSRKWRINKFDEIRDESFAAVFPEMYEIIKEDYNE
jgi:radical SAM protein with 4Fe4S-binding SPASM domain